MAFTAQETAEELKLDEVKAMLAAKVGTTV
jgi:hypothetical protein